MLKHVNEIYPEPAERIANLMMCSDVARDTETGVFLSVSHGRSQRGTGRTYLLHVPQRQRDLMNAIRFKAYSDREAIDIANKRLAKMTVERPKTCALCGPLLKLHGLLYKCPRCGQGYDRHSHGRFDAWVRACQATDETSPTE